VPRKTKVRRARSSPPPSVPVPEDAKLYINRELALLAFFRRVLEEAQDERNPLLERAKFLAIVGSLLAEFFMVRVAGLKQQIQAGVLELSIDGLTPAQQLAAIRREALQLMNAARDCLCGLLPQLDAAGIHILDHAALDERQKAQAKKYFDETIFPVLTPLAYDPGYFEHEPESGGDHPGSPGRGAFCARQSAQHPAAPPPDRRARECPVGKRACGP
jgi:polyphosphate kinase